MAEKMEVIVRVYDQEQDDLNRCISICSYDSSDDLIAFCTDNETFILNTRQVRKALDNIANIYNP